MNDSSTADSAAVRIAVAAHARRNSGFDVASYRAGFACQRNCQQATVPPILPAFRTGRPGRNGGDLPFETSM